MNITKAIITGMSLLILSGCAAVDTAVDGLQNGVDFIHGRELPSSWFAQNVEPAFTDGKVNMKYAERMKNAYQMVEQHCKNSGLTVWPFESISLSGYNMEYREATRLLAYLGNYHSMSANAGPDPKIVRAATQKRPFDYFYMGMQCGYQRQGLAKYGYGRDQGRRDPETNNLYYEVWMAKGGQVIMARNGRLFWNSLKEEVFRLDEVKASSPKVNLD